MEMNRSTPIVCALLLALVAASTPHVTDAQACTADPVRCRLEMELERLREIQSRVEDEVLALPGVVGLGIGREEDRLVFSILVDASARPADLPTDLEGVPTRVQRREPVRLLDGPPACGVTFPCHVQQQPLPVEMGNSGGWVSLTGAGACSLGFKACDLGTGQVVFVTNSHCNQSASTCGFPTPGLATSGWMHPGRMDVVGNASTCFSAGTCEAIGTISGHAAPACGSGSNFTDATKVASSSQATSMAFRDVGFPMPFPGNPLPGDFVRKSGRTSGDTAGQVENVNVTVEVPAEGGFCCGPLTMKDQVEWQSLTGETKGGDSGSALLTLEEEFRVVGLNWGSEGIFTYANHIDRVLSALDLSLAFLDCLQNCLFSAAVEAGTELAGSGRVEDGAELLELGRRFRDEVLAGSRVGRQLSQMYHQFSGEAVRLARRSPRLLAHTARLLVRYAPSLRELVAEGRTRVTPGDLQQVQRLLDAYAREGSEPMRRAIREVQAAMLDPEVQRTLGVEVAGGTPPPRKR
jgi:hypothetical protein